MLSDHPTCRDSASRPLPILPGVSSAHHRHGRIGRPAWPVPHTGDNRFPGPAHHSQSAGEHVDAPSGSTCGRPASNTRDPPGSERRPIRRSHRAGNCLAKRDQVCFHPRARRVGSATAKYSGHQMFFDNSIQGRSLSRKEPKQALTPSIATDPDVWHHPPIQERLLDLWHQRVAAP